MAEIATSPAEGVDLPAVLAQMRASQSAQQPGYAQRRADLKRLREVFRRRLDEMVAAVTADFGRRSRHEILISDGMTVLQDIDYTLRHLRGWMKRKRVPVNPLFLPARAELVYRPLGVVGIIAPWNYPVNLALMPLVGAIAAGNHVMLKPSELTPRTADFLESLLSEVFPEQRVRVFKGGVELAQAFAALPLDHLFFTGSTTVGRHVMRSASQHLTPVTLELGGKSPALVAPDFPLKLAAERIIAGKLFNAGQTCIAPDYALVPKGQAPAFVEHMREWTRGAFPSVMESPDYTAMVSERHYLRIKAMVDEAEAGGARIEVLQGAPSGSAANVFPPTAVIDAPADSKLMQEEIFGPVLPVIEYTDLDSAIAWINARERPLALYLFDRNRARVDRVLESTTVGGVTINDTLVHFAQDALPFGGVGPSGLGQYHGHASFLTFSKATPVMYQSRWSGFWLFKPPYRKLAEFAVRWVTR